VHSLTVTHWMTENLTNIAQPTLISLTHKGVGVDTTPKKSRKWKQYNSLYRPSVAYLDKFDSVISVRRVRLAYATDALLCLHWLRVDVGRTKARRCRCFRAETNTLLTAVALGKLHVRPVTAYNYTVRLPNRRPAAAFIVRRTSPKTLKRTHID